MKDINLIKAALYDDLEKRKTINIPDNVDFGLEIELEGLEYERTMRRVKFIDNRFACKGDKSLDDFGVEIATPVMHNQKDDIFTLKKLSRSLVKSQPRFDNCSLQLNFNDNLSMEEKVELFKVYCYFEGIIYLFSKGTDQKLRTSINMYAKPIYSEFIIEHFKYEEYPDLMLEKFCNMKMYGLNLKTKKNLIEFRTPNGTASYELWFNYINTFYHLLNAVKSKKYDKELVNRYINDFKDIRRDGHPLVRLDYEIDMEKCLQFTNLIFDDELDKLYFLKQILLTQEKPALNYIQDVKEKKLLF